MALGNPTNVKNRGNSAPALAPRSPYSDPTIHNGTASSHPGDHYVNGDPLRTMTRIAQANPSAPVAPAKAATAADTAPPITWPLEVTVLDEADAPLTAKVHIECDDPYNVCKGYKQDFTVQKSAGGKGQAQHPSGFHVVTVSKKGYLATGLLTDGDDKRTLRLKKPPAISSIEVKGDQILLRPGTPLDINCIEGYGCETHNVTTQMAIDEIVDQLIRRPGLTVVIPKDKQGAVNHLLGRQGVRDSSIKFAEPALAVDDSKFPFQIEVHGPFGGPLSGATVTYRGKGDPYVGHTKDDGKAPVQLPAGDYRFTVSSGEYLKTGGIIHIPSFARKTLLLGIRTSTPSIEVHGDQISPTPGKQFRFITGLESVPADPRAQRLLDEIVDRLLEAEEKNLNASYTILVPSDQTKYVQDYLAEKGVDPDTFRLDVPVVAPVAAPAPVPATAPADDDIWGTPRPIAPTPAAAPAPVIQLAQPTPAQAAAAPVASSDDDIWGAPRPIAPAPAAPAPVVQTAPAASPDDDIWGTPRPIGPAPAAAQPTPVNTTAPKTGGTGAKPGATPAKPAAVPAPAATATPPASAAPTPPAPAPAPASATPAAPPAPLKSAATLPVIKSQSGKYTDPNYRGTIVGHMIIPNLNEAIKLFTGQRDDLFRQLPKVLWARYENGALKYVFATDKIVPRNFGYAITGSVSRQADGTVIVSWQNAQSRITNDPRDGEPLTIFSKNNGSWTLKPLTGYDQPVYQVTWHAETTVDSDTLGSIGGFFSHFVKDSVITAKSRNDTLAIFQKAAELVRAMR